MGRYKQDDRNTGCIHTYYFIRHLHLHSETQEAEQHHFEKKHKSHKQMNHKKTNICNGKVSSGTELKQKQNTQTQHRNHNTKK